MFSGLKPAITTDAQPNMEPDGRTGQRKCYSIECGPMGLDLGRRTLLMGVINVTPDSFSDGGLCFDAGSAIERALALEEEGADLIDLGGESTRPGARPVDEEEELKRVIPVIRGLADQLSVPLSIDTYKAAVARASLDAGAHIVNDISAARFDAEILAVAAAHDAPMVLMHTRGRPETMQTGVSYTDHLSEICSYLADSIRRAEEAGVRRGKIIIDPGIGFGKRTEHNLSIVRDLSRFAALDRPILVGPSRKSFIGDVLGVGVHERLFGTAAAVAASIMAGAHVIRVHDVTEMRQVARMTDSIVQGWKYEAAQDATLCRS